MKLIQTLTKRLPKSTAKRRAIYALAAISIVVLAITLMPQREDPNRMIGLGVSPMDHEPSRTFVREVFINGHWFGSAGSGGSTVCCVALPARWRPDVTARIKWERCELRDPKNPVPDSEACKWHEMNVPFEPYESGLWMLWLHIMPGDENVLLIPSGTGPGHPDYPGPDFPTKVLFPRTE